VAGAGLHVGELDGLPGEAHFLEILAGAAVAERTDADDAAVDEVDAVDLDIGARVVSGEQPQRQIDALILIQRLAQQHARARQRLDDAQRAVFSRAVTMPDVGSSAGSPVQP